MPTYTAGTPQSQEFHVKPGEYKFRVVDAKEEQSKAGNPQIKLKLKILLPGGKEAHSVFDYLVFTPSSVWKVDAFLKATDQHPGEGQQVDVEAANCIGLEGRFRLSEETFKGKPQNKVESYLFDEF